MKPFQVKIEGDTVTFHRKAENPELIKRILLENQALISTARIAYTLLVQGGSPELMKQVGLDLKSIMNFIDEVEPS